MSISHTSSTPRAKPSNTDPATSPTRALGGRRTLGRVAAVSAVSVFLAASSIGGLHAASAAVPRTGTTAATSSALTPTARAAGLTPAGGARMGWSQRGVQGAAPVAAAGTSSAANAPASSAGTAGIDVSNYQGTVDWGAYYVNAGTRFAYMKATEGNYFKDGQFNANYTGSYNAKIVRGAYHFAIPDITSGATQAAYFLANGGGWTPDGRTLPGALDIEYNPYGATCYGMTPTSMVSWIRDFTTTYHTRTGIYPVIYTTADWWSRCTANSAAFSSTSPFWMASYSSTVGLIPAGAATWTFWQYTSTPLDQDLFNGDTTRLTALANGPGTTTPAPAGSLFTSTRPRRVLDTRSGVGATGRVGAGQILTLTIPGLPSTASAVTMNVTAVDPSTSGYLTVWPAGSARPTTSNLNFLAHQTVPNLVTVPVGAGGTVSFIDPTGSLDLVADLAGYLTP